MTSLARNMIPSSPSCSEQYLDQFFYFQKQTDNWRWRQHVARQMSTLATLYTAEITGTKIQQLVCL